MIDNAREIIMLTDDADDFYSEEDPTLLEGHHRRSLGADGYHVWCDRPTTLIIDKNGRVLSTIPLYT